MAESFLFSIAESLLAKLASRAFEEASRLVGLYDDLQDFTNTLSLVKAVLLDAQQKQQHNHELHEWLTQLKTVFSDAEDLLDEFECQTLRNKVVKAHGSTKDKVSHFFSTSSPLVFRYKMAQQIKDISNRLDKVAADRHKFSLERIDVDTRVVHRRDMTHSRLSDSDVIGRKHDKEMDKISFNHPVKLYDPLGKKFEIFVDTDEGGRMVLFGFCQYVAYYGFVSPCFLHLNYVGNNVFVHRIFLVEGVEIDYSRDLQAGGSNQLEVGSVDCEKILSSYDVRSSSLYLDSKFVKEGLVKGRKNYVLTNGHAQFWNCKIRWTCRSSFECYLTCGWKKYCQENGLVAGDRVRFMVQTDQSNVIQILKI
ncbi:hypothetical protein DEO72_LG6g1671 [Vigna unguiculata]|uniref:TF-B3 domain-containing protein n=1 Tax=Vigna unguiculata TaxID=3917 RepID=A0A4D6M991_VIGUN|nr:hypothetical protein DEO72_LG6g1671 [Vigna unguiculata]